MEYLDGTHTRIIVPAGWYILGDPCYTVPDQLWDRLLDSNNTFAEPIGKVRLDGVEHQVLGFHTLYGDGVYVDQYDHDYSVDAGLIGLVPVELATNLEDKWLAQNARLVNFAQPTVCATDTNGFLVFGEYEIDTSDTAGRD